MGTHSEALSALALELFSQDELAAMAGLVRDGAVDVNGFLAFDAELGGPSAAAIADGRPGRPGTLNIPGQGAGRYEVADREVFRPLQYCAAHLTMVDGSADWLARAVVQDSCVHIEALVKRIGRLRFLPLGALVRQKAVARKLDPVILDQVLRFVPVYNAAKHDFDQPKDAHMFSLEDALLAYFIGRRLALGLYPKASLKTDMSVFAPTPTG